MQMKVEINTVLLRAKEHQKITGRSGERPETDSTSRPQEEPALLKP